MNRLVPWCACFALAVPCGTASAAELKVAPGSDGSTRVLYQALAGEINAPVLTTTGAGQSFTDFRAPLIAGAGCASGPPVVCGFRPVEAHLGDRDDVASINSNLGSATVYGDSGDDDFLAGGDGFATAYGGLGDDTIRMSTDGQASGIGGPGDDRIGGGFSQLFDVFQGESGNDLLATKASGTLDGGSGDDELVSYRGGRAAVSLLGQSGNDVLIVSRGTADGGRGNDIIFGHAGGLTVNGGADSDGIDVAGGDETAAPDTVSCGSGFDVVWADAADSVSRDCEVRLPGPAPALPPVTRAQADADALLAHMPAPALARH
jgi:Ca2+-binding RTX toxin-like protein